MCRLLALALCLLPVLAHAGAWPRETGTLFVATQLGFASLPDETADGTADETDDETDDGYQSLYAEYGLSPRWTLGAKVWRRMDGRHGDALVFARAALGSVAGHAFAADLAAGARRYDTGEILPLVQAGVAWGKGFESRFGPGWLSAEAAHGIVLDSPDRWTKLDLTVGLSPNETTHLIVQLRVHDADDGRSITLAPSYVRRITPRLKVELGLTRPLDRDASGVGLILGSWAEF